MDGQPQMLGALRTLVQCCRICPLGRTLHSGKPTEFDNHVFSTGNISKWFVIGQNPGHNECVVHQPFVGDAGIFFSEQVEANGLKRSDFYITNTVKCYTAKNERPDSEHQRKCAPFLKLEIAILRPKLIITLGAVAFDILCPSERMGDHLGKIVKSEEFGVDVYPVYHPSPRNMSVPARRKQFIEDIRVLCELIKHTSLKNQAESQRGPKAAINGKAPGEVDQAT